MPLFTFARPWPYCAVKFCFSSLDGRKEKVMFDKITSRISKLCYGLKEDYVDPVRRTIKCWTSNVGAKIEQRLSTKLPNIAFFFRVSPGL